MIKPKVIYQYAKITMSLFLLATVCIGCTPTIGLSENAPIETTSQTPRATASISGTTVQKTSTPKATPSPLPPDPTVEIATPTPTISPTVAIAPTVVASATSYPVHGDLFFFSAYSPYEPSYLYSLSLETGGTTQILKQEDGQSLDVRFSPTGAWATYWVEKADHSELWLTPLDLWSPELVLTVPETDYYGHYIEWIAGEHYLFFQLYREILGASEPVSSYLINRESKQVVSPPDWKGNCNLVAFSPRTDQIATWCLINNEQDTSVAYAVIEENGEQWFSNERPVQTVKERESPGESWLWSHDRQYFVFSDVAVPRDRLNIMNTRTATTTRLADEYSNYYTVFALSPNNRYLAYNGNCANGDYCRLIMEIETEKVIWTSQEVTPPNTSASRLIWSPDSRYFAVYVSPELLIIEVETGKVVRRLNDLRWIEGVWLQDK